VVFTVLGKVNKNIIEFFEKMEAAEGKNSPQLLLTDSLTDSRIPQIVFSGSSAKFYDEGKLIANFENAEENYKSLWAFAKSYVEKDATSAGLTSTKWARRVISGILQAMIVLMEVEDKNGFSHSQRVAKLAKKIGTELRLSEEDILSLTEASMLHDVGKIGIEQLMMFTPTRIRTLESMPKDHALMGAIYLSTIEFLWDLVPAVRSHHERWDGKGYPDGLKGEDIPLFARIIAVCDYYDELTHFITSEWGVGPKSKSDALKMIIDQSSRMFDPEIVDVFVKVMESSEDI